MDADSQSPPRPMVPGGLPEGGFLERLTAEVRALGGEVGIVDEIANRSSATIDLFFLGYLRLVSQFGIFSFGPITIHLPTIEEIVFRTAPLAQRGDASELVRFTELVGEEVARSGARQINELHALLAFMKLDAGLPGRVFGELGVRPEEVEAFARVGHSPPRGLERLYSPEEAAEYLGIHVQTVRAWIRSGRLRASRLAGQRALRIRASDLESVLDPVEPESEPID